MSQLDGFFSLRTPRDLLEKLEKDFERLCSADPISREAQFAAFDFFVCAEHLPDWLKNATGGSLVQHRSYEDGALVSHVANGAKHFRVRMDRHTQAKDTKVSSGAFQRGAFQDDAFQTVGQLVIELENGSAVSVLAVAQRVLSHWKTLLTSGNSSAT